MKRAACTSALVARDATATVPKARGRAGLAVLAAASLLGVIGGASGAPSTPSSSARWQFQEVLPRPSGTLFFGDSVALSADGNKALVGAQQGAWIFTRRGGKWGGTKLDTGAKGSDRTVESVALSANGRVALLGTPYAGDEKGSAWIFTTRGRGAWVGTKLTGTGAKGDGKFGLSVALSADGQVALVGAPRDRGALYKTRILAGFARGSAWVFRRSGSTWKQDGSKLTGWRHSVGAEFGTSVALSGDGSTALIGGPKADGGKGIIWFFRRSSSGWGSRQPLGAPNTRRGNSRFGHTVALSRDGRTALVGGPGDNSGKGAAWFYAKAGAAGSWGVQGKLTDGGKSRDIRYKGSFAGSMALSADANTALIGSKGLVFVFTRSGSTWAQQRPNLSARGQFFGWSVALSADANTALISEPQLPVHVLFNPPEVSAVNPLVGAVSGGMRVRISGNGFTGVRSVTFGPTPASSFTVDSPTQITAFSPPRQPGTVDIRVQNSRGTSETTAFDRFTYVDLPAVTAVSPASGPTGGGTRVVITGTGLAQASGVRFGATEAAFKVDSGTQIQADAPPGQGTVDITVTTPSGTSGTSAATRFTYFAAVSFDELITGGPGAGAVVTVNTQYAARGVSFNGLSAIDYSRGSSALPGFAHSGTVAVEPCVGVESCTQPVTAAFSAPQRTVCVWVGFSFRLDNPVQVRLTALDAGSSVVGTATAMLPANSVPTPIRTPLQVVAGAASITQLQVSIPGGFNAALAVDDVTFAAGPGPLLACGGA